MRRVNDGQKRIETNQPCFFEYSTDQIGETVFSQFENFPAVDTGRKFYLSWSYYLKLMRISNVDERHFCEIESVKNDWSLSEKTV